MQDPGQVPGQTEGTSERPFQKELPADQKSPGISQHPTDLDDER